MAKSTPPSKKPTPKDSVINPKHYHIKVKSVDGIEFMCASVDLIEALCPQDAHLSHAYKYLTRAGKKAGNSYAQDIEKARWWLTRALKYIGVTPEE